MTVETENNRRQTDSGNTEQQKADRQWKHRTTEGRQTVETQNNRRQTDSGNTEQQKADSGNREQKKADEEELDKTDKT